MCNYHSSLIVEVCLSYSVSFLVIILLKGMCIILISADADPSSDQHYFVPACSHLYTVQLLIQQLLFIFHLFSFDDISSTTFCSSLNDLSIDGNPLANNPDHRNLIISYLTNLVTLNQSPVTVSSLSLTPSST